MHLDPLVWDTDVSNCSFHESGKTLLAKCAYVERADDLATRSRRDHAAVPHPVVASLP
jgi:hypothetical protein